MDGNYEPQQCHPISGECWCVDNEGIELKGTRLGSAAGTRPSCKCKYEDF